MINEHHFYKKIIAGGGSWIECALKKGVCQNACTMHAGGQKRPKNCVHTKSMLPNVTLTAGWKKVQRRAGVSIKDSMLN